jgi:hypothetical protein
MNSAQVVRMKIFNLVAALMLMAGTVDGKELMPTAEGTKWEYNVTEEPANPPIHFVITRRFAATEKFEGKTVLKLETFADLILSKTELLAIDNKGITCFARSGANGKISGLASPEIVVPSKLNKETTWKSEGQVADISVSQHWTVTDNEEVVVPAGKFQAFRFHCEESSPTSVVFDRWFVPGTGFVKEVTTMRSPTGDLMGRRTLELNRPPTIAGGIETGTPQKLVAGVSSQPAGNFETEFSSTVSNIYARWQGHGLRARARIRAVWIAEEVGDIAPHNYKIDDATTIAGAENSHGVFTLSRPETGWAEGSYRVEFYIDEALVESVKLKIK